MTTRDLKKLFINLNINVYHGYVRVCCHGRIFRISAVFLRKMLEKSVFKMFENFGGRAN